MTLALIIPRELQYRAGYQRVGEREVKWPIAMSKAEHEKREGERIIREVAEAHAMTADELRERTHERRVVRPRWVAMHRMRTELKLSFPKIAAFFGMHHTTVLYGLRRYADRVRLAA